VKTAVAPIGLDGYFQPTLFRRLRQQAKRKA
jgi:hypothetical protein